MKWFKLTGLATLAAVALAFGLMAQAPTATANNGPHGNFTLTSSACGGCHRAHTALSPYLIKADSIFNLCTSCHGGLVATDVVHGRLQSTGDPLNGGGFEQAVNTYAYAEGTPAADAAGPVTSAHQVDGLLVNGTPVSGTVTAFGGTTGGVGLTGTLECTSCHNPHGSTNYRILNDATSTLSDEFTFNADELAWVDYQVLATTDDAPTYNFTLDTDTCPDSVDGTPVPTPFVNPYGIGSRCIQRFTSGVYGHGAGPTSVPDITKGMNAFCATCHKEYLTMSGSAQNFNSLNTPTADQAAADATRVALGTPAAYPPYIYPGMQDTGSGDHAVYRHAVDTTTGSAKVLPMRLAAYGNLPNGVGGSGTLTYSAMGCLTCHFAHGSSAAATPASATGLALATNTPAPGATSVPLAPDGIAGDSSLLFYDNRGVCVSCHGRSWIGPVATVTPGGP